MINIDTNQLKSTKFLVTSNIIGENVKQCGIFFYWFLHRDKSIYIGIYMLTTF